MSKSRKKVCMNSYPPTFKSALLEFTNYVHAAKTDPTIDKDRLIEAVQRRLSVIIGKLVSAPTGESFSIFAHESPGPGAPPSESSPSIPSTAPTPKGGGSQPGADPRS